MGLKFVLKSTQKLEASLKAGFSKLPEALFKEIKLDLKKFGESLSTNILESSDYAVLKSDKELRAKLGLAKKEFRYGSDTDAEDLISLLQKFKVKDVKNTRFRTINIQFPTLAELEKKLTHNWTRIEDGKVIRGPKHSWFRWWEFGDRGEISSLFVSIATVNKIAASTKRGNKLKVKKNLTQLIRNHSRSGFGIQFFRRVPDADSSIQETGLIRRTYNNFGKVYPARVSRLVLNFFKRNGGNINRFFPSVSF